NKVINAYQEVMKMQI
ncbi:MAG: flagellar hook-basal body complex protein FliE, partial [Bryobacteraceae bacterium]